jgi:hypothetical protein
MTNNGCSSQKIFGGIGVFGGWWYTQFLVVIKKYYLEQALPLHKAVQEVLNIVCSMKQLAARPKIQALIGEALKKDGVAIDEKGLTASIVSHQVDSSGNQLSVQRHDL